MIRCCIEGTGNNLFVSILNSNNKMLFRCSIGLISMAGLRFRGTKKKTVFGAEQVGRFVGKNLIRMGFMETVVCFFGKWVRGERGCVRGLLRSGLGIPMLNLSIKKAHNGVYYKKYKRR